MSSRLRLKSLVWLIGAIRLLAALQVQLFADAGNEWPHSAPRYHLYIIIHDSPRLKSAYGNSRALVERSLTTY